MHDNQFLFLFQYLNFSTDCFDLSYALSFIVRICFPFQNIFIIIILLFKFNNMLFILDYNKYFKRKNIFHTILKHFRRPKNRKNRAFLRSILFLKKNKIERKFEAKVKFDEKRSPWRFAPHLGTFT